MLYNNLKVIDTDSHWSEPYDLWTSRAPAKWKDRIPQMEERDGKRRWWFDGNIPIGLPIASSVIGQDGTKVTGTAFFDMDNDVVHRASFDPDARVSMLDSLGIHAQIMYPNVAGFGNQNFLKSSDEALRLISVEIYNDALAEFQADTGERVFGMALLMHRYVAAIQLAALTLPAVVSLVPSTFEVKTVSLTYVVFSFTRPKYGKLAS